MESIGIVEAVIDYSGRSIGSNRTNLNWYLFNGPGGEEGESKNDNKDINCDYMGAQRRGGRLDFVLL